MFACLKEAFSVMKRLLTAVSTVAVLCAAALAPAPASADSSQVAQAASAHGAGSLIDASSAFATGSSQRTSRAVEDGWRRTYEGLPGQVQQAVPPHLRPPVLATPADTGAPAGVAVAPAHDPSRPPESPRCSNCVAVTYDDGPVTGTTEQLLDTLKRKDVHATFFVLGQNANAHPEIVRRIRDEGHTIGSHSFSHADLAKQTEAGIAAQLDETNAALKDKGAVEAHWLRPPYGSYDSRVVAAAAARGMSLATWDVDTADWQHRNTATTCQKAVAGAREGSIILMHDIHQPTVAAAECVIDGLRAKGLNPVSLDEMIPRPEAGQVYTRAR